MLLWSVLRSPSQGESQPEGALLAAIEKHWTSFDGFKESFHKAVASRVIPGWVWLGVSTTKALVITQTNNEDNPLMNGIAEPLCTPIIGIDLWEHAYFTTFKGDKSAYCAEFLKQVNWSHVSTVYSEFNLKNEVGPLI